MEFNKNKSQNKLNRIFIALPVSLTIQNNVLEIQNKFKHLKIRWVNPKNLHITLVPPWYEKNIPEVVEKLNKIEGVFQNFKINFNLIEYGPNKFHPRLIWAVGGASPEILKLQQKILECLNKKPENKMFKLHLTLARFNQNFDTNSSIKNLPKLDIPIFWEDKITKFVLMRSHLLKTGADYEIIKEINLEKYK